MAKLGWIDFFSKRISNLCCKGWHFLTSKQQELDKIVHQFPPNFGSMDYKPKKNPRGSAFSHLAALQRRRFSAFFLSWSKLGLLAFLEELCALPSVVLIPPCVGGCLPSHQLEGLGIPCLFFFFSRQGDMEPRAHLCLDPGHAARESVARIIDQYWRLFEQKVWFGRFICTGGGRGGCWAWSGMTGPSVLSLVKEATLKLWASLTEDESLFSLNLHVDVRSSICSTWLLIDF